MREYTLGFCFSTDESLVALIKKNHPSFQIGKFNGIGGLLEAGENVLDCMVREFLEETGVTTERHDWTLFAVMSSPYFKVNCFYCFDTKILDNIDRHKTSETISMFEVANMSLIDKKFVHGVNWLIAMALEEDKNVMTAKVFYER